MCSSDLSRAIDYRINSPGSTKKFGSGLDQSITNLFNQLCVDVGIGPCVGTSATSPPPIALTRLLPTRLFDAVHDNLYLFGVIAGTIPLGPDTYNATVRKALADAAKFASSFAKSLAATAHATHARANALVAADHSSFASSRDLLIGAGAGSLALALALGLLLSWSLVAPLRRTQERLSEIAAGDFAGHVEVPNRDEIGRASCRERV